MEPSRLTRAVVPARVRMSTMVVLYGLLVSGLVVVMTIAVIKADGSSRDTVVLPQPIHHWRLDADGTDSMNRLHLGAADHDGRLPMFERGRRNFVGVFNGCEAFQCYGRAFASARPVDFGHAYTISTWVRSEPAQFAYDHHSILANEQLILGKRGSRFEVMLRDQQGNTVRLESSVPIVDGRWMHVSVTRTAQRVSLWVDGNESRMDLASSAKLGQTLYIGRNAAGYPWSGMIDDVIVWNRALDAAALARVQ